MSLLNFHGFDGAAESFDRFLADQAVFPGGTPAFSVGRNNHPLVSFPGTANSSVFFPSQMDNAYDGTDITVSLFWAAATAVIGSVRWFVSWERDNPTIILPQANLDVTAFAGEQVVASSAPSSSGLIRKAILVFTNAEADGIQPGDPFRLRIRRDGGLGGDTMLGAAQLFRVSTEGD